MTSIIDLDSLLAESMTQQAARKLNKHIGHVPGGTHHLIKSKTPAAVVKVAEELRQWEFNREWTHTQNVIVFTRQRCKCCDETASTFDGFFVQYTNNRRSGGSKMDRVDSFELDKPKAVVYRDSYVPICHNCADVQQDWPLEE